MPAVTVDDSMTETKILINGCLFLMMIDDDVVSSLMIFFVFVVVCGLSK